MKLCFKALQRVLTLNLDLTLHWKKLPHKDCSPSALTKCQNVCRDLKWWWRSKSGWYCMYRILNWAKPHHRGQSLLINFYQLDPEMHPPTLKTHHIPSHTTFIKNALPAWCYQDFLTLTCNFIGQLNRIQDNVAILLLSSQRSDLHLHSFQPASPFNFPDVTWTWGCHANLSLWA